MQDWLGIVQTARIGGWMVYPLSLLAIVALAIVLDRAWVFWRVASWRDMQMLMGDPVASPAREAQLLPLLLKLPPRHAARRLLEPLIGHAAKPDWWIEARAQALATDVQRDVSRGLWVLETIVTAAPLLGLLGTIVGMMQAFRLIGNHGLVNPAGVTGGVAQALVATAIGLVIALVALFAFNYFSRRIETLLEDLETLANVWLGEMRLAREHTERAS
jgi:biopolymer transport protein ExbB